MLTLQIKAMQESLKVGLRARERLGYLEPFALEELWQQSLLQRAVRAPREATERTQILQQALCGGGRCRALCRLSLQIDLRTVEDEITRALRARLPGGIQRRDLPRRRLQGQDRGGQLLSRRGIGARKRHQILHRRVRAQDPETDLILDRLGQGLDQGESPAHPALAVLKTPTELLERPLAAFLQLCEQPGLIERVLAPATQAPLQEQRFDFFDLPARGARGIARQALERPHALAAIDEDELLGIAHHDDRGLLADLGERSQKRSLAEIG